MLSSKKLTWKRLCGRCLSVFKRLEIQSVMLLFSTNLWCPSNLLSGSISPLPPVYCTHTVYSVWGGGMGFWALDRQTPAAKSLNKSIFYMTTFCIAFCESCLSKHYIDFILKLLWRILGSRHWRISPHTFHDLNTLLAPLLVENSHVLSKRGKILQKNWFLGT